MLRTTACAVVETGRLISERGTSGSTGFDRKRLGLVKSCNLEIDSQERGI
jgi:hypothetical protein